MLRSAAGMPSALPIWNGYAAIRSARCCSLSPDHQAALASCAGHRLRLVPQRGDQIVDPHRRDPLPQRLIRCHLRCRGLDLARMPPRIPPAWLPWLVGVDIAVQPQRPRRRPARRCARRRQCGALPGAVSRDVRRRSGRSWPAIPCAPVDRRHRPCNGSSFGGCRRCRRRSSMLGIGR